MLAWGQIVPSCTITRLPREINSNATRIILLHQPSGSNSHQIRWFYFLWTWKKDITYPSSDRRKRAFSFRLLSSLAEQHQMMHSNKKLDYSTPYLHCCSPFFLLLVKKVLRAVKDWVLCILNRVFCLQISWTCCTDTTS